MGGREDFIETHQAALDATDALGELLSVLEPCIEMVEGSIMGTSLYDFATSEEWRLVREAKANAAAKLADFENGTEV